LLLFNYLLTSVTYDYTYALVINSVCDWRPNLHAVSAPSRICKQNNATPTIKGRFRYTISLSASNHDLWCNIIYYIQMRGLLFPFVLFCLVFSCFALFCFYLLWL
jgi:hypothetical protein